MPSTCVISTVDKEAINGLGSLVGFPLPAKSDSVLNLTLERKSKCEHLASTSQIILNASLNLCVSSNQRAACLVKRTHLEISFYLFHRPGPRPPTSSQKTKKNHNKNIVGRHLKCLFNMSKHTMILILNFHSSSS